jgi:lipopolysaccharide transport system permease protein
LKDISPLIRLLSQLLFWSLPILYRSEGLARTINIYHPLNLPLDLFRALVFRDYSQQFSVINWLPFLIVFIFVFYFSRHRFQKMVMDHL